VGVAVALGQGLGGGRAAVGTDAAGVEGDLGLAEGGFQVFGGLVGGCAEPDLGASGGDELLPGLAVELFEVT
jgi:hypothetical protein